MTQKEVAIQCLKSLNIYTPYINKFEKDSTVTLFERFGGYYINKDQEPELLNKIKEFEAETGSLVYAVTHEMFFFGECYSFLIVSEYDEEWEMTLQEIQTGYAFAYVWNKSDEICSEFGTVGVKSFGGGIARIA